MVKGKQLPSYIDHTILKIDTKKTDIKKLCTEAEANNLYAVCVPPYFVQNASMLLKNSDVKIATVIGFPLGYSATPSKAAEIHKAIDDGADELDVVINVSAVKSGDWNYVQNDIKTVVLATQMKGKIIKVILETGLLNKKEIKKLCEICADAGVNYVKTSTGFNGDGATEEVVEFLRANLPGSIKIKASGGIKSVKKALKMIEAGADRLGTSSSMKIIKGIEKLS
ncbi:MAG: deoxyribose-phosphate aldolase [Saprospiraceae bacterium]